MSKKFVKSLKKPIKKTAASGGEYTAKQITVLEGLEPVRQRPGMYIGSTGVTGLHHLVWEVVDNAIDEAMAGFCDEVRIRFLSGSRVEVSDNGRGIPVDMHKQFKVSALELVLTKLHAGGKFGTGGYKVSGGLHGVGVSVVNALSKWLKAEVRRDGGIFVQEYSRGRPEKKVRQTGKSKEHGTTIVFEPDPEIFTETLEFDWQTVLDHLRQQAYLTKGVKIIVSDERKERRESYIFYFEGGIASYARHLNRLQEPKHDNIFYAEKKLEDDLNVEVALRYVDDFKELVFSFANNIYNPEGGMHLQGFRTALTRTLNAYARDKGYLKEKDENLTGEDSREGLTAVISVKLKNPQFEGQTKAKLGNPEVKSAVETVFGEAFAAWLEEHPRDAEAIIGKCVLAAKARAAAKIARDTILRKGALEGFTLPGKLADCSTRDASQSELYIVEGDSAGGCFSGDTRIALTDGRNLNFKEIMEEWNSGKRNYCYTIKENGEIGIERILFPRLTRKKAEVVKVILDDGEEIICTPDHRFMLRDGSFAKAEKLKKGNSLMPLRKKISQMGGRITIQGYEMVLNPATHKWVFAHLLADKYNLENGVYQESAGSHKHHLDFNKLNNNPDNLRCLTKEEHLEIHRRRTPHFREKRKRAYNQTYLDRALGALHSIYTQDKTISFDKYNQIRKTSNDKSLIKAEIICQRFFGGDMLKLQEAAINYNHRVKNIIRLSEKVDVYDIEVPKTHNFALADGVFVHNSAKQGRDREFQAILPLRGKILNVEKARLDKMLTNNEIKSLIIALGTNIGEMFDIAKLRYHRVVIMTDADVDGSHIRTLLLTLFYRYFPELINQGHIYIAQPPLYRVQVGKEARFVYSDEEKERAMAEMTKNKEQRTKSKEQIKMEESGGEDGGALVGGVRVNIQRYKGLGEMNPEQLWETTMNPSNRMMKKVTVEDAEKADEIFDVLMGDEVEPRKRFIQTHAKTVKNLDI